MYVRIQVYNIYRTYTCADQTVELRKDNVWRWTFYIFDYNIHGRIAAEVPTIYYYTLQQCVYYIQTESCSSVIKKQISILLYIYSLYRRCRPIPKPISYYIVQLFYFNVVAVIPVCPVGCPIDGGKRNSTILFSIYILFM